MAPDLYPEVAAQRPFADDYRLLLHPRWHVITQGGGFIPRPDTQDDLDASRAREPVARTSQL